MKRILLILALISIFQFGFSQVGINTTSPNAQLDIKSSNQVTPSNTDGILIPKIDAFPSINPTSAQNSMLVYLTTLSLGKQPGFYYWDDATTTWIGIAGGKGWDIIGNTGTNPTTNFIGTTDNNDLAFRRNNVSAGKISQFSTSLGVNSMPVNTAGNNTAYGNQTLVANTTGNSNTAIGSTALFSNTIGNSNIALGYGSMNHNTTAGNNTAVGNNSLFVQSFSNGGSIYSSNNTAIGDSALFSNNPNSATTGINNTAIGSAAMEQNNTGYANVAVGKNALNKNTTGWENTAIGVEALDANTWGYASTAVGYQALKNATSSPNTAFGWKSAFTNTNGQNNVAVGPYALYLNNSGSSNVAVGGAALQSTTSSGFSTAVGNNALSLATGMGNVGLGSNAGSNITTGAQNIAIGMNSTVPVATGSDQLSIGNVIYGNTMSTTALGKIGIGEPAPAAKLQISSATPATPLNTDGIIIPRVSALTAPGSMTTAQNGLMVFLTTPSNQAGFYYWDDSTTSWKGVADKTGWSLTGNAGTDPTVNFIGTTDDVDVVFHRDFLEAGRLGYENTSFGRGSLRSNTGVRNTAVGDGAMGGFITGFNSGNYNTAVGSSALSHNKTGASNSSFGSQSLISNNEGSSNAAFGDRAMVNNTNASKNVAVGQTALFSQDFANGGVAYDTNNVAVGLESLYSNKPTTSTNGINNTAVGNESLRGNKTASDNTAIGFQALKNNTNGEKNVAIGKQALFTQNFNNANVNFETANTAIGFGALYNTNSTSNINGSSNIGIGKYALSNNATGNSNVAIGSSALGATWNAVGTMTGDKNIAIGGASLKSNSMGSSNIAIGGLALNYNTTGNDNVALGDNALYYSSIASNAVAIGSSAMKNYGFNPSVINDNVAVGFESMKATGNVWFENTAIGYQTLTAISSGNGNTASGYKALTAITTGSFNTAIGNATLSVNTAGSGNVALGYQAGFNETGSNKLYIDNSNTTTPLIYGDFSTDRLRINGNEEVIKVQLTADGDGQNSLYALRNRDSQNDGTGYTIGATNNAIAARNLYGDLYTFGVAGYSDNDFSRSGGVFGGCFYINTHWASLGYKSSASTPYGVYASATNTFASGAGRMIAATGNQIEIGVGGGFYGGVIGSWSKGTIGSISSGNIFASYNSGDEYTSGKQIELVDTGNSKTAAYTVTSTDIIIYKKGKIALQNGTAHVAFDTDYARLLGDDPVVTTTPMGQCNGIYIESVDKTGFIIRELNNGTSNVMISWIAVGDRIDAGKQASSVVLDKDFDNNLNEVMFNENDTQNNAKAMWSDGRTIEFGELPESLKDKVTNKQ